MFQQINEVFGKETPKPTKPSSQQGANDVWTDVHRGQREGLTQPYPGRRPPWQQQPPPIPERPNIFDPSGQPKPVPPAPQVPTKNTKT